jgi:hypothetical protein
MGKILTLRLPSDRVYRCRICHVDLAFVDDCISKVRVPTEHGKPKLTAQFSHAPQAFRGSRGPAYLFTGCVNVICNERSREEHFTTGRHVVCDIFCGCCMNLLGWKYIVAYESSQKYKEGKYIIDKSAITSGENDGNGGNGDDRDD